MSFLKVILPTFILFLFAAGGQSAAKQSDATLFTIPEEEFLALLIFINDKRDIDDAISRLDKNWQRELIPILLESSTLTPSPEMRSEIYKLLRAKTGERFHNNINDWFEWLWQNDENISSGYALYKANLYKNIDPRFEFYFKDRQQTARVRLDEIRWGGVQQDGIPPLRNPEMLEASEATYMQDDNIIFGIEINGDARAYPKRILAWHEMFTDTVGGEDIAGVYCTLCGTVIPYKTQLGDTKYNLGTSGFLYRSNKLMYDSKTQSLWNTMMGEPVLGPLAGTGVRLDYVGVVTTTWSEWTKRHPNTMVLSMNTGFNRDYSEGEAYKDYFSNDDLMFSTPFSDDRLDNKQEILALRFAASPGEQLAIDAEFLAKNPLYVDAIGLQNLIVLTDKSGANRVYDPADIVFSDYDGQSTATDENGVNWALNENDLTAPDGRKLPRLPAHRAFWFGWHAAFPETRLVK